MKIGFSSFVLDRGRSGIASYIIGLLNALQKIDHENFYDIFAVEEEASLIPIREKNFSLKLKPSLFRHPSTS